MSIKKPNSDPSYVEYDDDQDNSYSNKSKVYFNSFLFSNSKKTLINCIKNNNLNYTQELLKLKTNPSINNPILMNDLLNNAISFWNSEKFQSAYQYFWAHILVNGNKPEAFKGAIRCAFKLDSELHLIEELLDYFLDLSIYNQNNPNYYFGIGNILFRLGEYKNATWYLKHALNLDANHTFSYGNLAKLFLYQGDFNQAILFFKKAKQSAKRSGNQKAFVYIYTNLGYCYFNKGDIKLCLESYKFSQKWAIKTKTEDLYGFLCLNLGDLHFCKGELDEAFHYYCSALQIFGEQKVFRGVIRALSKFALASLYFKDINDAKKLIRISKKFAESILDYYLITELGLFETVLNIIEGKPSYAKYLLDKAGKRNNSIDSMSIRNVINYYSKIIDNPNLQEPYSFKIKKTNESVSKINSAIIEDDIFSRESANSLRTIIQERNDLLKKARMPYNTGIDTWLLILPHIYEKELLKEIKKKLK